MLQVRPAIADIVEYASDGETDGRHRGEVAVDAWGGRKKTVCQGEGVDVDMDPTEPVVPDIYPLPPLKSALCAYTLHCRCCARLRFLMVGFL